MKANLGLHFQPPVTSSGRLNYSTLMRLYMRTERG